MVLNRYESGQEREVRSLGFASQLNLQWVESTVDPCSDSGAWLRRGCRAFRLGKM